MDKKEAAELLAKMDDPAWNAQREELTNTLVTACQALIDFSGASGMRIPCETFVITIAPKASGKH